MELNDWTKKILCDKFCVQSDTRILKRSGTNPIRRYAVLVNCCRAEFAVRFTDSGRDLTNK